MPRGKKPRKTEEGEKIERDGNKREKEKQIEE